MRFKSDTDRESRHRSDFSLFFARLPTNAAKKREDLYVTKAGWMRLKQYSTLPVCFDTLKSALGRFANVKHRQASADSRACCVHTPPCSLS